MEILVIGDLRSGAGLRKHGLKDKPFDLIPITGLFAGWDGQRLHLVRSDTHRSIDSYAGVYLQSWGKGSSMARLVAHYLAQRNVPSLNTQLFDTWPITKIAELCRLTAAGVPHPRTVCTQRCDLMPQLFAWAKANLGFALPVVVKAIGASHGNSNFLIQHELELVPPDWRWTYLVQEYIPNQGDYRILIVGGRPVVAIWRERVNQDTHLNNTSKGGHATVVPLDQLEPAIIEVAVRAAVAMNRTDLAGIDVVVDTSNGRPYVLEANLNPDILVGATDESDVAVKAAAVFDELQKRVNVRAKQQLSPERQSPATPVTIV